MRGAAINLLAAQINVNRARIATQQALGLLLPSVPACSAEAEALKATLANTRGTSALLLRSIVREETPRRGVVLPFRRRAVR
jgi:hypothetical protein